MEKNRYTKTWKGIGLAINIISVSILAVSLIAGAVLLHACGGDLSAILGNRTYETSSALQQDLLYTASCDVGDYLWQQEYFETNGTFDLKKNVDALSFSGSDYQSSDQIEPLEYTVEELKNWSGSAEFRNILSYYGEDFQYFYYSGYDEAYDDYLERTEVTEEPVDAALQEEGNTAATETTEDDADNTDFWRFNKDGSLILSDGLVFREQYAPKGYDSLKDYSVETNVTLESCYEALYETLASFQYSIAMYKDSLERLDPDNTNLRYTAKADGSDKIVSTNIPEGEQCKKSDSTFAYINEYEIEAYVNTDYPVEDQFWENANSYNYLVGKVGIMFAGLLAGLIGTVVSLIYLTIVSGHVNGKEEIALCWVDLPKLELAVLAWGFIGTFVVLAIILTGDWYADTLLWSYKYYEAASVLYAILVFLTVAAGAALFLTGYLSFVRRIKAKQLWENSYCHLLAGMIKTIIQGVKVSAKLMTAFGLYLLFTCVCILIGGGFGLFLGLILNAFVAWVIVKDAFARQKIMNGLERISGGELDYKINLDDMNILHLDMAEQINQVGTGLEAAVEQSLRNERMKTDLITNVSHDIKTPLTSIINYVDLLKRENIQNEKAKGYIDILDQKSQRLKHLTEDLVEASKISSGNVTLELVQMDFNEILQQALGEFEERFQNRGLKTIVKLPDTPLVILADGRRIWRILENLFQNVVKYALPDTRVYVEAAQKGRNMVFTIKNISENPLNINADELTERFIRGDVSRSTEGSGLGLSIAKNLTTLQKGEFDIYLDGDLFKVTVTFGLIK